MIRIAITTAAFEAIAATLPGNVGYENKRAPNGDWYVWLDHAAVAKLKFERYPGESFSDTIIRLARGERD